MTLLDTLDYFIQDQQSHLQCLEWDIREETNQEEPQLDWYCEEYDATKQRLEDLESIKSELARLQRYDEELSSVMPKDYKDWWQNSPEEWPIVAKYSIESLGEREKIAWEHLAIANKKLEEQNGSWKVVGSFSRASTSLAQEFIRLKRLWSEETSGVSSVTRILLNHHYLKIISLGPKVIPLILAELSKKPDHWFVALAVLSDSDPTEPGFTFTEATDAWLKWGREKGYLAD